MSVESDVSDDAEFDVFTGWVLAVRVAVRYSSGSTYLCKWVS